MSAVTNEEAIDGSIAKLFGNGAIVKNARLMSCSRPACDNVGN